MGFQVKYRDMKKLSSSHSETPYNHRRKKIYIIFYFCVFIFCNLCPVQLHSSFFTGKSSDVLTLLISQLTGKSHFSFSVGPQYFCYHTYLFLFIFLLNLNNTAFLISFSFLFFLEVAFQMDVLSRNRYYRQQKKAGALMPPAYPTTTYYKYPHEVKIHPGIEKRR